MSGMRKLPPRLMGRANAQSRIGGPVQKKKLTITVDADNFARPLVVDADRAAGYAAMAADTAREADADAWSEALVTDVANEREGDR